MWIMVVVLFLLLMEVYRILVAEGINLGITSYTLAAVLAMVAAWIIALVWTRR